MQMKKKIFIILLIISSFIIHIINKKIIYHYFVSNLINYLHQKVIGIWVLIGVLPLYILPLLWLSFLIYIIRKYKDDKKVELLWLFFFFVFIYPGSVTLFGISAIMGIP